ncbi:AAA family ATPase [Nocardia carnea]|uniref:AAA family ATPase n=1 Tax=Nocardia carnea TaxID=37328 RepID=UPI002458D3B6|nr:AAA family ATPase [Nocardia carnea]
MRLHRLQMTAFGPFAETTTIDFDELGADGLFLLHGRTGAGKTTILDAIAYALYGRVPGARGDKRLHSDHAPANIRPEVDLEATLGGRRVRIIRSPEFERPKLRGSGTRVENAKATLTWLDGRGTNLSRINEIGDEVIRLLGMSADQFFQVVLLPQGDFARFLRAENEDRERLLEKLFDTGRFGTAEQWLAAQRKNSGEQIGAQQRNVEDLITRVAVTAGIDRTERIDILDAVEWSQDLLTTARGDLDMAQRELALRRAESADADEQAESERRAAEQRRRLSLARQQLDDYAAGARQREADRAELERARRAEPVAAALTEAEAAVEAARGCEAEAEEAARRLARLAAAPESLDVPGIHLVRPGAHSDRAAGNRPGESAQGNTVAGELHTGTESSRDEDGDDFALFALEPERAVGVSVPPEAEAEAEADTVSGPGATVDSGEDTATGAVTRPAAENPDEDLTLDTAIRGWSAHLGKLAEIRSAAADAEKLRSELGELRETDTRLRDRAAELTAHRAQLPEILAAAQARAREADDAKAALPGLRSDHERLRQAATAAVELAGARTRLDRARVDSDAARAAHLEARERVLDLRAQRLAGMAAELAGHLVDGQACAVCGSADHPQPARPGTTSVSESDEAAAVAAEHAAHLTLERSQSAMAEVEREIEALVARGGDTDRVELAAALDRATDRCGDAEELAATADECAAELTRLRADENRLHDALRETETQAGAVAAQIRAGQHRLTEIERKLRTAAGRDVTIGRRRERLYALIAAAGERRETLAAARAAWDKVAGCVARVEKLATAAGFGSYADQGLDRQDTAPDVCAAEVPAAYAPGDVGLPAVTDVPGGPGFAASAEPSTVAPGAAGDDYGRNAAGAVAASAGAGATDATGAVEGPAVRGVARDAGGPKPSDVAGGVGEPEEPGMSGRPEGFGIAGVAGAAAGSGVVGVAGESEGSGVLGVAGDAEGPGAGGVAGDPETAVASGAATVPAALLAVLRWYAPLIAAATRTRERQETIRAALAAAEELRAAAQAVVDEPEIQAAAAAEPRDPDGLAEAVHKARQALDEAVAVHGAAVQRVTRLETLCGQLWAAVDLITPAQRAHRELAELAEVVAGRGENNRRMSLRSYVLAARLEEVAVAGSARLRRMSGGRFEFVHTDRAGTHGRRGGLGLDIHDDYTGVVRPARTLSGGETFMASLSLALGLADTVAAEAGGIILDTLFIDEGFGSLDADTLDAVMGVLDELRAGGRVVGLVSHVDEMRQRIPSRLHVIRGPHGSRVQATVV